jgi:hypothetical protein
MGAAGRGETSELCGEGVRCSCHAPPSAGQAAEGAGPSSVRRPNSLVRKSSKAIVNLALARL